MGRIFNYFLFHSYPPSSTMVLQPLGFQADEGCVAAHVANEREALEAGNTGGMPSYFQAIPTGKYYRIYP